MVRPRVSWAASVFGGKNSKLNVRSTARRSAIRATEPGYSTPFAPGGPRHGRPASPECSVAEVALAGEDHGDAVLVGGIDHVGVADRAPRLDDDRGTGRHDGVEPVAE